MVIHYMLRYSLIILMVFLAPCSNEATETFTSISDNPAKLINNLNSYQPIGEAEKTLNIKLETKIIVENSGLSKEDKRPPFNIYTVSYEYEHLGVNGTIVLHYFNNRLKSTWFYPNNYMNYIIMLRDQGIADLTNTNEINLSKYTKLWTHKDYQNKFYIAWQDIRLSNEQSMWIRRYS